MKIKWKTLWNPFELIAGEKALGLGLLLITGTGLLSWPAQIHFDGVIDLHFTSRGDWWQYLAEGWIDWLSICLVLTLAGRIFSKSSPRLLDIIGTQALARYPAFIVALLAVIIPHKNAGEYLVSTFLENSEPVQISTVDLTGFILLSLAGLVAVIWMIALMYNAFSVSCNLKGAKAIWIFTGSVIAGEILSKIALNFIY